MESELAFKILDTLARNPGKLLSIRALTEEMSSKNKTEFYANVYHQIEDLRKNDVLKITRAGRSNLIELNFSSDGLQPALTEMELLRANKLFENARLATMRKGLDALFYDTANTPMPHAEEDVSMRMAAPAFIVSELTTAFQMGVMVLLPFLVIDLVVASVLMSLGMMMMPPQSISLPLKLLLFVAVDGWHLLVGSLLRSFV